MATGPCAVECRVAGAANAKTRYLAFSALIRRPGPRGHIERRLRSSSRRGRGSGLIDATRSAPHTFPAKRLREGGRRCSRARRSHSKAPWWTRSSSNYLPTPARVGRAGAKFDRAGSTDWEASAGAFEGGSRWPGPGFGGSRPTGRRPSWTYWKLPAAARSRRLALVEGVRLAAGALPLIPATDGRMGRRPRPAEVLGRGSTGLLLIGGPDLGGRPVRLGPRHTPRPVRSRERRETPSELALLLEARRPPRRKLPLLGNLPAGMQPGSDVGGRGRPRPAPRRQRPISRPHRPPGRGLRPGTEGRDGGKGNPCRLPASARTRLGALRPPPGPFGRLGEGLHRCGGAPP